ncbi:S41 family peptidase [Roseateles sp. BYS180W]|uniref:S41 family peptidase n=1 Tax=Roseateles rivi TaxID=3299028 RepID=A0ABW7FRC4_9BURK
MSYTSAFKLSLLSAALLSTVAQAEVRTDYLSKVRPQIKFNELTRQDKQVLAEEAQKLLRDLYVNRYDKDLYYGTSPNFKGHVNPALAVQQVVNRLDSISTAQLHAQLSQIFVNQRDLHLNYNFPAPHSAFITFLPFQLTRTSSAADANEVRIGSLFRGFFEAFYPGQRKPAVGDQVLEYNGLPIAQAVQNAVISGNGANLYAGFSRALQHLTFVSQASALPPSSDAVSLKLRSAQTGEVYSVNLPWLTQYDDADLAPSTQTAAASQDALVQATALSQDNYQDRYNAFVARNSQISDTELGAITKLATPEPSIKYAVVNKGDKKVGYISIGSFVPQLGDNNALAIISTLLRNQLAATDALVIDVRNNGGGSIVYADKLPQLFIPGNAKTNSARFLNTKLNFDFLNQDIFKYYWPNWVKVITEAQGTGQRFSKTEVFTSPTDANLLGQAYYKPVGVLANARSYSATDLFTCAMRDNGAATIFGEDAKTGAGGANVLTQDFFAALAPQYFKPLPGGVSMRVSWRQSVRNNYNNDIIEDHGCDAQVQVPRTLSDLSNGDQTQFDKVAATLLAQPAPKSTHRVSLPATSTVTLPAATRSLSLEVNNTEHVLVYVNGALLKRSYVGVYGGARTVAVDLPAKVAGERYHLAIVGVDGGQRPLWNTKRVVVVGN